MTFKSYLIILTISTLTQITMAQSSGKYANINGLKMYYEIHGSGYPLVLIHGGGSTINTTFGRILPALAKSYQVIAIEMQAHGHTAVVDRPLSFEQDADDVAGLLKHLGIKKANIFGFSNGASTTLHLAIRHTEVVNKIIVASTFYKKTGTYLWFWEMMSKATFEEMPQTYKDAFLQINPDPKALYRMFERDVARMQSFQDIPDDVIKGIKTSALVIAGSKDVVSPEHAVEMYRNMQQAELLVMPGGHGDYIGEITTPNSADTYFPAVDVIQRFLK